MRAVVLEKPLEAHEHKVIEVQMSKLKPGWVLVRTKAFGILKRGGIRCMSGILGGEWEIEKFAPMDFIPSRCYLIIFDSSMWSL